MGRVLDVLWGISVKHRVSCISKQGNEEVNLSCAQGNEEVVQNNYIVKRLPFNNNIPFLSFPFGLRYMRD